MIGAAAMAALMLLGGGPAAMPAAQLHVFNRDCGAAHVMFVQENTRRRPESHSVGERGKFDLVVNWRFIAEHTNHNRLEYSVSLVTRLNDNLNISIVERYRSWHFPWEKDGGWESINRILDFIEFQNLGLESFYNVVNFAFVLYSNYVPLNEEIKGWTRSGIYQVKLDGDDGLARVDRNLSRRFFVFDSDPWPVLGFKLFLGQFNGLAGELSLPVGGPFQSEGEGRHSNRGDSGDGWRPEVKGFSDLPQPDQGRVVGGAIFCVGVWILLAYLIASIGHAEVQRGEIGHNRETRDAKSEPKP